MNLPFLITLGWMVLILIMYPQAVSMVKTPLSNSLHNQKCRQARATARFSGDGMVHAGLAVNVEMKIYLRLVRLCLSVYSFMRMVFQ